MGTNCNMILISATNLTHKRFELTRYNFKSIGEYKALSAVIYNFRKYIVALGYNCSLLDDCEIMAFEEVISIAERDSNDGYLIEILEFLK
jgi:hypothetical protein